MSSSAASTLERPPVAGDDSWLAAPELDEQHPTQGESDSPADALAQDCEAEHQLIGALLWLPATHARAILQLVPDTVIWRPRTRWAYQIIRTLVVDAGQDPDPVAVLAAARSQPSTITVQPGRPPTAHQLKGLSMYLFDAYQSATDPHHTAGQHALEVLDAAYRRAFRDNAIRMHQLAATDVEPELLTKLFTETRKELADLWRRAEAAAKPGWDTP